MKKMLVCTAAIFLLVCFSACGNAYTEEPAPLTEASAQAVQTQAASPQERVQYTATAEPSAAHTEYFDKLVMSKEEFSSLVSLFPLSGHPLTQTLTFNDISFQALKKDALYVFNIAYTAEAAKDEALELMKQYIKGDWETNTNGGYVSDDGTTDDGTEVYVSIGDM